MKEFQLLILRNITFSPSISVPKKSMPKKREILSYFFKGLYNPAETCAFGLMPAWLKDYSGFQPFILRHAYFKFRKYTYSERNKRTIPSLLQNILICLTVQGNYQPRSSTMPYASTYPNTICLLTIKSRGSYANLVLSTILQFSHGLFCNGKKWHTGCIVLFFR